MFISKVYSNKYKLRQNNACSVQNTSASTGNSLNAWLPCVLKNFGTRQAMLVARREQGVE